MRVGIYANIERDKNFSATEKLMSLLSSLSVPYALHSSATGINKSVEFFGDDCEPRPDVVFAIGGDGTILSAASFAAEKGIPILGVNVGHTGFLSEFYPDTLEECVKRLVSGDYTVISRSMVETEIGGERVLALNELAFYKKNIGRTVTLTVKVDGETLNSFKCDGFIVSTPTGSTAYALSSGGPIIEPNVGCHLLVPINCHHLSAKPVVVNDGAEISICGDEPACVIADGRVVCDDSDGIIVRKSDVCAKFITMDVGNFFKKLHEKLGAAPKED